MAGATKRADRPSLTDRVVDRLPQPVRGLIERVRDEEVLLTAAGLGFYALVSVGPLVVVTMWVTSLVLGDQRLERLADQIGRVAPEQLGADGALRSVAEQGTRLGLVAVFLALWPGSAYGSGLVRAFGEVSTRRERHRTPLLGRLLAVAVLLPMFIMATVVLTFAGATVLGDAPIGRVLGVVLALVGGFVAASLAAALIYRVFPQERLSLRQIGMASAIAGAGSALMSLALVLYVSLGANFEEHYASSGLAAVVLLAIWLFVANIFLVVGYQIAEEGGRRR